MMGNSFSWAGSIFWPGIMIPFVLWSLVCTGLALWNAAKRDEYGWFIFFLFVHTAGFIELFYLLFVVKIHQSSPAEIPEKKKTLKTKSKK